MTDPVNPYANSYGPPPINMSMAGGPGYTAPLVSSSSLRALGVGEGAVAPGINMSASAVPGVGGALKAGGIGGEAPVSKLGEMLGNLGSGVSILGDLAGIYLGFQQQKMARHQFGAQLGFANANLENSVKSYNNRYSDMLTARGFTQSTPNSETQQAITSGSLNFRPIKG